MLVGVKHALPEQYSRYPRVGQINNPRFLIDNHLLCRFSPNVGNTCILDFFLYIPKRPSL